MRFNNDLSAEQTKRTRLLQHVPISLVALGVFGAFVALHLAIGSVLILAVVHVVIGLGLMTFQHMRSNEVAS